MYRSFLNPQSDGFYRWEDRDLKSLAQSFETLGFSVGEHFQFQPQKDTYSTLWPICLFLLEDSGNYVAVKPRTRSNLYCVPQLVILESVQVNEAVEPRRGPGWYSSSNVNRTEKKGKKPARHKQTKSADTASLSPETLNKGTGSRWSTWYARLTPEERKAHNQKKYERRKAINPAWREMKSETNKKYYESGYSEIIKAKFQEERDLSAKGLLPESKKEKYQTIKEKAAERSRKAYADPEKREIIKQKAAERSRAISADPVKAAARKQKQQEWYLAQKALKQNGLMLESEKEKYEEHKRKAAERSRKAYADPEKREIIKKKAAERSRAISADPVKAAARKQKQQERYLAQKALKQNGLLLESEKEKYEEFKRKAAERARKAYADPVKREILKQRAAERSRAITADPVKAAERTKKQQEYYWRKKGVDVQKYGIPAPNDCSDRSALQNDCSNSSDSEMECIDDLSEAVAISD